MNNASIAHRNCHINLASAALLALRIGKDDRLSLCPKSEHATAIFRIVGENGKPDYDHPAIPLLLAQVAAQSNHVKQEGNTLKLVR